MGETINDYDWSNDEMKILSDAMFKAKETFDNYINNKLGLDGAYWSLEMTGYTLYSDFKRNEKIFMDFDYCNSQK